MSNFTKDFKRFQSERRSGEPIKEAVVIRDDKYVIGGIVVKQSFVNSYKTKVKKQTDTDLSKTMSDQEIAEELVKYTIDTHGVVDSIPVSALLGGEEGMEEEVEDISMEEPDAEVTDDTIEEEPAAEEDSEFEEETGDDVASADEIADEVTSDDTDADDLFSEEGADEFETAEDEEGSDDLFDEEGGEEEVTDEEDEEGSEEDLEEEPTEEEDEEDEEDLPL